MKLFTSKRGAVSVFLVLILVPTLIVTSVFVDVSRMFLGQSVTESAADLALNSKLSQFDKELNEMYGLFANAQSVDDVSSNLNKYFESCLVSAGVETTDLDHYGNIISDLIDDDTGNDFSDMLRVTATDTASIKATKDGNLGNPEVIESQIVNFMKYRAPVDIVKKIIKRLKNVTDGTENVEDESELTDKMNEYLEEENNVLTKLQKAYEKIKEYKQNSGMNLTFVENLKTSISGLKNEYKARYIDMFKNLYNTQGIYISTPNVSGAYYTKFSSAYNSYKGISEQKAKFKLNDYINKARKSVSEFIKVKKQFDNFRAEYGGSNIKSGDYPIQWYVAIKRSTSTYGSDYYNIVNEYSNKLNTMNNDMARLKASADKLGEDYLKGEDLSGYVNYEDLYKVNEIHPTCYDYYSTLMSQYKSYFNNNDTKKSMTVNNNYEETVKLINRVYNDNFKNGTSTETSNAYFKDTSKFLKDSYDKVKSARDLAKEIKNKLNDVYKLLTKSDGLNAKLDAWEKELNNSKLTNENSSVKKQSQEIHDSDDKEFRDKVTEQNVLKLKNRFDNIETLLNDMLDYIDGVRYNGKKVKDIASYNAFKNASKVNEQEIVRNQNKLEANAKSNWEKNSFAVNHRYRAKITISSSNTPDITDVLNSELYKYMDKKFKTYNENADKTEKNKYEDMKKKNKDENKDEDLTDTSGDDISKNEIGSGKEDKEKISNNISEIASKVKGFFTGVSNAIKEPTNARDDLYVLDYAMNMFSYHTYNKEGLYNIAFEKGENGLNTLTGAKTAMNKSEYKTIWEDENKTFTDNKSLTNFMIKDNYSFGNEIEYILNGKSNDANKSAVFGKLFVLRYALNLGPEFRDNWTEPMLNGFADTINLSFPFIPAALVKTVVILALTAAESAYDVKCLKEGMKMPLIKTQKDELLFSFETLGVSSPATKSKSVSEMKSLNYVQYSDYLTMFLFVDLLNSNSSKTLSRIGDVIGRNVGKYKGLSNKDEDIFEMSKANTNFVFTAEVQVPPLLLSVPLTQGEMNKVNNVSWWKWSYETYRGYN